MLSNPTNIMGATSMVASIGTVLYVRNNFTKLRKESKRQAQAVGEIIKELESQSNTFKAAQKLKKIVSHHSELFEYYDQEFNNINSELEEMRTVLNKLLNNSDSIPEVDKPKKIIRIDRKKVKKERVKPTFKEDEEEEEDEDEEEDEVELSVNDNKELKNIMNRVQMRR